MADSRRESGIVVVVVVVVVDGTIRPVAPIHAHIRFRSAPAGELCVY
ncbi:MAG: hypothetical protein HYY06_23575 [Deltaproteobacteria bacterium]|nr:hypothetical protein [Deltaproteobacteria bacterium]